METWGASGRPILARADLTYTFKQGQWELKDVSYVVPAVSPKKYALSSAELRAEPNIYPNRALKYWVP